LSPAEEGGLGLSVQSFPQLVLAKAFFCLFFIQNPIRVARWYVFKPKIPIWVNIGGPWNGKVWYTYSVDIWNILWTFGIFYGRLVI
jgi:hypothetical protein